MFCLVLINSISFSKPLAFAFAVGAGMAAIGCGSRDLSDADQSGSFNNVNPAPISVLQKQVSAPARTSYAKRGLGFGKSHCWEMVYGQKCSGN